MAFHVADRLLDRLLPAAIDRVGQPSGLRFTERQLYYETCRGVMALHRLPRQPGFTVHPAIGYPAFARALHRHGPPAGQLPASPPPHREVGRHTTEPDLFDYGLPRLLVCESHDIATMLRLNGIPMESGCPVVSAAELPLDAAMVGMLAKAPGATIYLLHEASAAGLEFAQRLPGSIDVPDGIRIVPIGMRPRQAAALHLTHQHGPRPRVPAGTPTLDEWELRRLRGGRPVEIEAVRPQSLLRTVHRLVRDVPGRQVPLLSVRQARTAGFLTWPAA